MVNLNCGILVLGSMNFNFTLLNQIDTFIQPCNAIPYDEKITERDQCSKESKVCQIITNIKDNNERVLDTKQFIKSDIIPDISLNEDKTLSLVFKGKLNENTESLVNLTMTCDSSSTNTLPSFTFSTNTTLSLYWKTALACAASDQPSITPPNKDESKQPTNDDKKDGSDKRNEGGSFFGSLFKFLGIGLAIYFVLGCIFNYTVNRVRSFPEILPNYEFWVNLFHVVIDILNSLKQKLSSRSSSGGQYVQI